jgi:hypothetical protein
MEAGKFEIRITKLETNSNDLNINVKNIFRASDFK